MNRIMSEIMPLSPDDGLASPVTGPEVLPREPVGPDLHDAPAGWFVMLDDDRFLTIDQDGSTNFGGMAADEDPVVLFGELVDQPLVLPGEHDAGQFDVGPLSDLYSGRHGDMHLTVTDDGRVLGGLNGRDGSFNFGDLGPGEDQFVLSGDFIDQPLVLPGASDIVPVVVGSLSDFFSARHGAMQLTVTEDGLVLGGENWIDTSGLYNWA